MPELTVHQSKILPNKPFLPTYTGAYLETVTINKKQRQYISYAPADVRASTSGVLVIPGNGVSSQELYEGSNWTMLADTDERKEKFIVFFLEPGPEGWDLENPEEDLAYVQEVYLDAGRRNKFCVHEAKFYLTGFGEGGAVAQMAAMNNPAIYAGLVSVNAPSVDPAFIEKTGNSYAVDLNGFEDQAASHGIVKKELCMPTWLISDKPADVTASSPEGIYWRNCAGSVSVPRQLRPDVAEYYREDTAPWTINQEKEAFRVWISAIPRAAENYCNRLNRRIWAEFLRGVVRMMSSPGGDLRIMKDPVIDLGMEYHYVNVGGWMREYYCYVPDTVKKNPEKKVPLVFAMHGYSCSGEIYTNNSEWFKVAAENQFIVVFPSAVHGYIRIDKLENKAVRAENTALPSWNVFEEFSPAPDELEFFDYMLAKVTTAYVVDKSRIFATGHSQGSLMTQLLGMARPNIFAAIAPCSGVLFAESDERFSKRKEVSNRPDLDLPIWMFGGEKEEWLMPAVPEADNMTGNSIYFWWNLNKMDDKKPADFETLQTVTNTRWNDYVFEKKNIPMIRYTWVEYLPHATMTEMSFRIWNEFFSKIRRDEDGSILYGEFD